MQKEIVEAFPDTKLGVYVVWVPMIPTDSEAAARNAATMFRDARVHQYYDPSRLAGTAYSKDLKPDQFRELLGSLANDDPLKQRIDEWFARSPVERPIWDAVYFFAEGAKWTDTLPAPSSWVKQIAYFGNPAGEEPSGLFFRHDATQPPSESDWHVEIRAAITKLVGASRSE